MSTQKFDAQETWGELLTAIATREWRMVKELAIALRQHVAGNGECPQIFSSDLDLPDEFTRGSVLHECEFALQLAEDHINPSA